MAGLWQLLLALLETALLALLETALPYLVALVILALVAVGLVVAALVTVAREVSLDDTEGGRLRSVVRRAQRRLPV